MSLSSSTINPNPGTNFFFDPLPLLSSQDPRTLRFPQRSKHRASCAHTRISEALLIFVCLVRIQPHSA